MEHRKQMQQEAVQWQKTSVKIIQGIRYGVLIFGILLVAVMFLVNLGFPKKVNTTCQAMVVTAEGDTLEATVELKGQMTNYPLNGSKHSLDDTIIVYLNGIRILELNPTDEFFFGKSRGSAAVLSHDLDSLILETNIQNFFPELDSGTCLVYFGNSCFDLPGAYADCFTFLNK